MSTNIPASLGATRRPLTRVRVASVPSPRRLTPAPAVALDPPWPRPPTRPSLAPRVWFCDTVASRPFTVERPRVAISPRSSRITSEPTGGAPCMRVPTTTSSVSCET